MTGRRATSLFLRGLFVLFALAIGVPAAADNTADEADLRFRRGVEAYRAKRFEDALAEFFHSNRLARNRNVILNIGRCYEQLKMYEEAYRYYDEVLAEAQEGEDRKVVEESLARLAPQVALLQVRTVPPNADIYLERKDLGSRGAAPKTLALKPGKVKVLLGLAGHREASREVELVTGQRVELEVPLEFIYGTARVEGSPAGAEIRVDRTDGPPAATVPASLQLKPGRHILNLSAPGHLPLQAPVDLKPDEVAQASVTLQPLPPPTGNLVVTANHEGALVQVDGKESGFTPAVIPLAVGRYRVSVTMPDMRPYAEEVEIKEGERSWVKAELRFAGAKTTAASKTETSAEDAPASITVITREEIRAFGYSTLPEALRSVRGLFLSNDRAYDYLGVRGFSPPGDLNDRILILFDGHPMNDIFAGQAYLARENNIDLSEVERIEVVRGPVSSLFGSAAFFGVINIVPRRDLGQRNAEATAAGGSLGLARGRATGSAKGEGWEALLTGGALAFAGEDPYVVPPVAAGAPASAVWGQDAERAFNASTRARWKELTLLASVNGRKKLLPTGAFESDPVRGGTNYVDQRGFVEGRWERKGQTGWNLTARGYYDATRYRGTFVYPEGEQVERGWADWVGAELRFRSAEILSQNLTAGIEAQQQLRIHQDVVIEGEPSLNDERSFTVLSAYLADEINLGRRLSINASARADEYLGSFGLTVNPRLAFIARLLDGGTTKLMGGRSFRAPTAYERYYHDGTVDPATGKLEYRTTKPSPDLSPEVILTGELEHTQEIGGDVSVVGSAYVNHITDLIIYVKDPGDGLLTTANASGSVRTLGGELELRWQPTRLTLLTAAYWYQRMQLSGIEGEESIRLRTNAPAHAFSLRAMFPIAAPTLLGSAEATYNGSRLGRDGSSRTGEMLIVNAGLSGELPGEGFRWYAGVQNLLDERPALPTGYDLPQPTLAGYGRTFVIQATASY